MPATLDNNLRFLERPDNLALLRDNRRGIEKESLRVDPNGRLALTPHPAAFGSPLTHDRITTDFSESLLEFITPVCPSISDALTDLDRVHREAYAGLNDEILWSASMPCALGADDNIPVARYGNSNVATMKSVYRTGLGHRYTRRMQTIAGIHYNFSVAEALWKPWGEHDKASDLGAYRTTRYFDLIRNFHRWSWLLVYLMGAAPAICESFLPRGREHDLDRWSEHTLYRPHGTSLRMGDLGYQSDAQRSLNICYNQLETYIDTLSKAIQTPWPEYSRIGVHDKDDWRQLSDALLQIENEFYSPIRPKRITHSGEIPLGALRRDGVEYIEVRCIDVSPFHPLGIDETQCHFLEAFLLYCLCEESPVCNDYVTRSAGDNLRAVVNRGRQPGLELNDGGLQRGRDDWGTEILHGVVRCAELLDTAQGGTAHLEATEIMIGRLQNPDATPSAQILSELKSSDRNWFEFALQSSREHAAAFKQRPLSSNEQATARDARDASLAELVDIEAAEQLPFDEYLANFYRQYDAL